MCQQSEYLLKCRACGKDLGNSSNNHYTFFLHIHIIRYYYHLYKFIYLYHVHLWIAIVAVHLRHADRYTLNV